MRGRKHPGLGWAPVAVLFCALVVPRVLEWGMFHDGLVYASVSRNLAAGIGTLWAPSYTQTVEPIFREHPPLAFALQSLSFRVLGGGFFVEKLHGALLMLASLALVAAIWSELAAGCAGRWIPVLLLLAMEQWSWALANNLLETIVTPLCLGACYAAIRLVRGGRAWAAPLALGVLLGFLAKGPVALFPLAAPLLLSPLEPGAPRTLRGARTLTLCAAAGALVLAGLGALALWPAARQSLSGYLGQQVLPVLAGERGYVVRAAGRLFLALELARVLAPIALVAALVRWSQRRSGLPARHDRAALAMLLVGLSGSLPLSVSQKQMSYYLLPSLPFFALGFGLLVAPRHEHAAPPQWLWGMGWALAATVSGVFIALSIARAGEPYRDHEYAALIAGLEDLSVVPADRVRIGVDRELWRDWALHAYLQRFLCASLTVEGEPAIRLSRTAESAPGYALAGRFEPFCVHLARE